MVRFVGEPVAVVVTEERYQGEDAAELVDVDYDPLPAVVDLDEAAAAATRPAVPRGRHQRRPPRSATPPRSTRDLFDGCEVVVTPDDRQPAGRARADGDRAAAAAVWGEDGRLTAWIPNQGAQGTQRRAGRACSAIDPSRCGSSRRTSGGAFGAKFGADPEHAVVVLGGPAARPPGPLGRDPDRRTWSR